MTTGIESKGLNRSAGVHSKDIMLGKSLSPDASEENMFSTGKLTESFQNADPFFGRNTQTFTQSLLVGDTQKRTSLQAISPKSSYKTDGNNAKQLDRSAQSPVADGGKMQKNAATMEKDIKSTIARAGADLKQFKSEQADAVKNAAADRGISNGLAQEEMSPQKGSDKLTAGAAIAADALIGGGTFAVMGKAAFVVDEAKSQDKKLSKKELEALAADSLARNASSGNNEAAMDSNAGASVKLDVGAQSKFDYQGMSVDEYIEAGQTNIEDTPEVKQLSNDLAAVEKVQDNLSSLEDRADVAFDLSDEKIDAISVELTGQGLRGISSFKPVGISANDASLASVSDMSSSIGADTGVSEYKPSTEMLTQMQMQV